MLPLNTPPEKLKGKYGAIIISGGPGSCYEADAPVGAPQNLIAGKRSAEGARLRRCRWGDKVADQEIVEWSKN